MSARTWSKFLQLIQNWVSDTDVSIKTTISGVAAGVGVPGANTPFDDYAFGADDTFATLTVSVQTEGAWIDISNKLASTVTVTIISESAAPNYSYEIHIGRKSPDSESAVIASGAGVTAKSTVIPVTGYNKYCTVKITPTGSGAQLNFKAIVSAQE